MIRFFYISEVIKKRWIWIIPTLKPRKLFLIRPGFSYGDAGEKEIECFVFDRSILEIVEHEVRKYAYRLRATAVKIEHDYD